MTLRTKDYVNLISCHQHVMSAQMHETVKVRLLVRDAFVRTNRRNIAIMFVRLSVRLSVCLYV